VEKGCFEYIKTVKKQKKNAQNQAHMAVDANWQFFAI
jgi:hypothetical protein